MHLAVLFEEQGSSEKPSRCTGTASPLVSHALGPTWRCCLRTGDPEGRAAAPGGIAAGEPGARTELAELFETRGPSRKAEVCTAEPSPLVSQALGRIWQRCSRDAGSKMAEAVLQAGIAAGELDARAELAALLRRSRGAREGRGSMREGIAVGEPDARADLAAYSSNEATRRRRRLCSGPCSQPAECLDKLAHLLEQRGEPDKAEDAYRRASPPATIS